MNNISAIKITKNEEYNITDFPKGVDWVDEIIFVDAESADRTIELAKLFDKNIFVNKWDGLVKQKEFALSKFLTNGC